MCLATSLDAFLSSLRHEGILGIDRLVVSLFRRCMTLQRVQVMQ